MPTKNSDFEKNCIESEHTGISMEPAIYDHIIYGNDFIAGNKLDSTKLDLYVKMLKEYLKLTTYEEVSICSTNSVLTMLLDQRPLHL